MRCSSLSFKLLKIPILHLCWKILFFIFDVISDITFDILVLVLNLNFEPVRPFYILISCSSWFLYRAQKLVPEIKCWVSDLVAVSICLASQDALEVMNVTY